KWLREQRPDDPRGGFAAHKFKLFNAFLEMLPALARGLPEQQFIIRPHPSERISTWQALAEPLPNVSVHHRGNVVAWLQAADALVHNGCTTAVEAFLVGCAAFAYMPVRSPTFDHPLPNGISLACQSLTDLLARIDQAGADRAGLFARQSRDPRRQRLLEQNLASVSESSLDSERILDCLDGLLTRPGRAPRRAGALMGVKRMVAAISRLLPGSANYGPYLDHMFPPTSLGEAQARANQLAAALGLSPSFRLDVVSQSVFRVTTPDKELKSAGCKRAFALEFAMTPPTGKADETARTDFC
ncbi:MAG: surface carbohydrate biosynthesis protein, partial [Wenzhouxiangella sp.]